MVLTKEEKARLEQGFQAAFGYAPERYFSAPGRTEIGGNHTDHQRGRVLAGAVDLDTRSAVAVTGTDVVRVMSQGHGLCEVSLTDVSPRAEEQNTTAALIRGVAARFMELGCPVRGFDAYIMSTVLPGSGLSSSAAFEVLLGTVVNCLFFDGRLSPEEIAQIGQYAENVYFGKPCGLMDQMTSAVGGLVTIDFAAGTVSPLAVDFAAWGHALCIIDTHASHADLTEEYAAVPGEMKAVAEQLGKNVLSEVNEDAFYAQIPTLRQTCGDRAVLRAIHFFEENRRVNAQCQALERGDFQAFLSLVKESGRSSYMYLQNVLVSGSRVHQDVALALALCEKLLAGRGAFRVHGGGFAGTVQAFVPHEILKEFRGGVDGVLGQGSCRVLSFRREGGIELEVME